MARLARPPTGTVRIRPATSADLSPILTLLLTSYRQFPLFAYLYSPLHRNLDWARDTRFFWRRQLRLCLLTPGATLLVAETNARLLAEAAQEPAEDAGEGSEDVRESWRMLKWVQAEGPREEQLAQGEWEVCGWAVWKLRQGDEETRAIADEESKQGWLDWFRSYLYRLELQFWAMFYQRRDLDAVRHQRYLESLANIEAKYYSKTCYFLDILCVDFRRQKMGIGAKLVDWGITEARQRGLPAYTEAGPKGERLYRRAGFEEIGTWTVEAPDRDEGPFVMPVMRLD